MTSFHLLLPTLAWALAAAPCQATEAEFQSLLLSQRHGALETLARERLARDPLDEAALWYWGQQADDDPRMRAELLAARPGPRARQAAVGSLPAPAGRADRR